MKHRAVVLLADDEPDMLRALQAILARHPGLRVLAASDGTEAWALAQEHHPDLIVSDYEMPGMNGFEFCRHVKADPVLADALFIVLTGFTDTQLKVTGLNLGVDDYLTKPVEAPEFLAKIRASLRIKSLQDQLRADKLELERLHAGLEVSFDRLLGVLIHMVDIKIPGAAERGHRLRDRALGMARRMDVPARYLYDLEMAARLHEIGRLVEPGPAELAVDNDWAYLLASRAILEQIDSLRGVADIVIAIGEHWDGSGAPRHLMQGQIPLRSRILRVLIDYFEALRRCTADAGSASDALASLQRYSGTRYDPLVLTHLKRMTAAPEGSWIPSRERIPLSRLCEGMVLAEDLSTSSGVKLLSAGARITATTIDVILKRHVNDPILYGAWVQR